MCPFALDLEEMLKVAKEHLPSEALAAERLWQPVYDEYRRIHYRLKGNKEERNLFNYDEEDN
jgi:hypothetical protein